MHPVYVYRTPPSSFRCAAPASKPWKASCRRTMKKEKQEEKKEEIGVAAEEELAPERELEATEGGTSRRGPCRPSAHQRRPLPAAKGVCPPPPPPPPHGHHDQNDSGHSRAPAGVPKERHRWHLVRLQAHRPPPTYALQKAAAGRRCPPASRAVPGYPAGRRPCRPRSCVPYSLWRCGTWG